MRPVRSLLIYAGFVFLGGALLAPWLYWGVQSLATPVPQLQKLAQQPFHRYVNRSLLLLALAALWPLMRSLGVGAARDVGLVNPKGNGRNFAAGLGLGLASLAGVTILVLVAGARQINGVDSAGLWTGKLLGAALTTAVVAVLEEILFRGAIFGALRKTCRWPAALALSSMIYALVHFFSKPQSPVEVQWSSGLVMLTEMLSGFVDVGQVAPGFFTLTLAGAMLAVGYQRTGNLYFSIGLHAGWIFWLRGYSLLTRETAAGQGRFWGTGKLMDGWLALAVLAPAFGLVWKYLPQAKVTAIQDEP